MTARSNLVPISSLPLPPTTHIITHNLTPDPYTPNASVFRSQVLTTNPSIQRRTRLLAAQSHFSYVSPLPLPFPYEISSPDPPQIVEDKSRYIEEWLHAREAVNESPLVLSPSHGGNNTRSALKKYFSKNRDQARELIGIAETGLKDCLPLLDVGDAFDAIGKPSLAHISDEDGKTRPSISEDTVSVRQELIDVLSGHAVLMSADNGDTNGSAVNFAPWSSRYSGHQFGTWAGQLGDGRAISSHIVVTPHPSDPDLTYELQLKGSGRTPFSRSADGLAVLRSSIREYLCSEAMQALSIPTTRSLALISLPELPVVRERVETACVLTRVAPSFIRIGSFEAFNPPRNMFFFGGGQQDAHWDGLRDLGDWVQRRVLKLGGEEGQAWGQRLVLEVAKRNAKMVAGWQAYGFMHGVMNTDNISILGLTIDYGPYAFMDVFDKYHICNHTDEEGRYAYLYQPNMIIYALRALLDALSPLIGAESELGGKAVAPGWAEGVSDEIIARWRKKGLGLVKVEMERIAEEVCSLEYRRLMHKRLALRRHDQGDEHDIFSPLLEIMQDHRLDFHSTFRKLSFFKPSLLNSTSQVPLEDFVKELLGLSPNTDTMDYTKATADWLAWLDKYSARIESERGEWKGEANIDDAREKAAKGANPRFVLRQWVLEEVIAKVEKDAESGKRLLAKVLQMACSPFEPWGAEGLDIGDVMDAEIKQERQYCGMGEERMLGFQCSCSS